MKELLSFSEVLKESSRGVAKIPQKEFCSEGAIPIIDQGKNLIAGYCDVSEGIFYETPAIVFGDHTRCIKFATEPFVAGADGVKIFTTIRESDNPRYYYHALCAADIPSLGYSRHFKLVKELRFVVPNRDAQDRAVCRLDYIERQIETAQSQLAKLDDLVKSRFVEMFGDPIENPFGWDIASLGELGDLKNGVNFKSVDSGTEIRCLGVGDFKNRHQIRDMGLISLVSLNGKPNDSQLLRDGDIVFVRSNGNKQLVGRCLAVFPGDEEVTFSGFCIRFRSEGDKLQLDYLLGCLKSDPMRKAMIGRGANIQNLSQKILSEVAMPIPPLALQQEFAAFVQQVDKLRFDVQQSIDKLQMLYDSLAQEYFSVDEVQS